MKILKLLNKYYLSIILLTLFVNLNVKAEDKPIDIWNIEQKEIEGNNSTNKKKIEKIENEQTSQSSVYNLQSQEELNKVLVESSVNSQEIKIIGLYDPEDYSLKIDMWSNSNGDQLKYLFSNLSKIQLSNDATELMNIALLTNSYHPDINMKKNEFLKIKSDWLIKINDRELIEEYLLKNLFFFIFISG